MKCMDYRFICFKLSLMGHYQEGNFLIIDIGVSSKMKNIHRRDSTRALAGSDISGTIGHMASELFSRNSDAVKATDIWALGATIYGMVTGELPLFGHGGVMLMNGAEEPSMEEKNDVCRMVAWRYRNNLFRGKKTMSSFWKQLLFLIFY